jgi:hypothetical protein
MLLVLVISVASALSSAAPAELSASDEARLGAEAPRLHALVDTASRAGLPPELLVDKAREGLAKGVPPARIVAVVRGLADALGRARAEAQPFVGAAPPRALLKAIVEAHAAGVAAADATTVLRSGGRERAMQVLTDLVQRGYPAAAAARAVASFAVQPAALEQLVGRAERLRGNDAAPRLEVLDALTRANAQGLGIDHAEQLLHRAAEQADDDDGRGPNRETSGPRGPRSGGIAPPGRGKGH